MATFEDAIQVVLKKEGGYVHDPTDAGGETNFGISKRRYPEVDIKGLTRAQAMELYRRDFWNPMYEALFYQPLATKLFELTLHLQHGDTRPYYETDMLGIRLLQKGLRRLGDPAVTVDGRFGPQTLQAVKLEAPRAVLCAMQVEQCRHYLAIVDAAVEQGKFFRGWIRRAIA
ncbi:MAG: glycosyl hydrolase 108 family protein [Planctomycetaceae bacterium]|nr:glycosyl hydrolase 108 family protein [Planctomycetaceae bacterium]